MSHIVIMIGAFSHMKKIPEGVRQFFFVIALVFVGMIVFFIIIANLPSTKERAAYGTVFGNKTLLVRESSDLVYSGQDKLKHYDGRAWIDTFIPPEYISEKPEDVGGIVSYERLNETRREVAKYTGGSRAYAYDYRLRIIDPFTGYLVYEGIIKCDTSPPQTVQSNRYLSPKPETVTAIIKEKWSDYLNDR